MTQIQRHDADRRRSRAVVHGNTVYLAGQVADDKSGDITRQTTQALAKIDALLRQVGSDKSKLLSATIWLRTMADYDGMNRAWDGWVDPQNPPARCCGTSELADPRYLVEIIATAAA
jgi:enamine deaminase RidA (YjgF/YER057c/UK114 family)